MPVDKSFKTYRQQMKHLRDNKHVVCNGSNDKTLLCRYGYFNLINGYKMPFVANTVNGKHFYIHDTNIYHFSYLKNFDDALRYLLFKYIVTAEEEIRTFSGYKFDQLNLNGSVSWYEVNAYDPKVSTQNIVGLISKTYSEISKSKLDYVNFYMDNHKAIPTWILMKVINFSTFIDFVNYSRPELKRALCRLYNIKKSDGSFDYQLLISSLHCLRKTRNACAHNERVYCMYRNNARCNNIYLDLLPSSYRNDRTQKTIDLLTYLKFYLSADDYNEFITGIKNLLWELQSKIPSQAFSKVRADLGLKDIQHLDILLSVTKQIEYNRFDKF
ncbi:MAG: Abi family protein [Lachnospiraceae bacterium]|nr:Abi family protein [Lachnospiraceae bacterium]